MVELSEDLVDQTRHLGEQAAVVAEERPECLGHREHELAMEQLEEDFIGEMLGEKDRAFATAGGTKVEALARKTAESSHVRTQDSCSG